VPTRSRSSWAKRALALALGSVLGLCVLELGVRWLLGDVDRARLARDFGSGYGAVPADSWIFDFAIDPRVHQAVELRGQRVTLPKPAGQTRVLVLGDSATEGAFVAREQAYPERLASLLHERGERGVVVLNAGVWGMTTIDELRLLEDKLLPLAPDVVVLGLFVALPERGGEAAADRFLVGFLLVAISAILLNVLCMTIRVMPDEITIHFGRTFYFYSKHIGLDEVRRVEVIDYRPIAESGGWGIRWGKHEGQKARYYSARGARAVLLDTEKGLIIIGSPRPEMLAKAVTGAL
jgi:hypothetical protein